jgi:hypothetical protein
MVQVPAVQVEPEQQSSSVVQASPVIAHAASINYSNGSFDRMRT